MGRTVINNYRWIPGGVDLFSEEVSVRIEFVAEGILRMWTTLRADFCQDETLVVEKKEFSHPCVRTAEYDDRLALEMDELNVNVYRDPFSIDVRDRSGKVVFSTPLDETIAWSNDKLSQSFCLPEGVKVYGLGQGSCNKLDLRGTERRMWNQWDAFRYSGNAGIPFLMTSQGYAGCAAYLSEDRECTVKVMGEDKLKVWINGKLAVAADQCHGTPAYSRVKLNAGRNEIFIKCSQFNNRESEIWSERSWGFYCTLVDQNREPIEDIVYSVD